MSGLPAADFVAFYQEMYAYIGFPLEASNRMAPAEISKAEKRLGVKVPKALAAYYQVAGKNDAFNLCLDELLRPDEWYTHKKRLVFYQGHQAVVAYGIRTDRMQEVNPPVEMGNGAEPLKWFALSPSTTNFFQITTYWQGAYAGAMVNVEWATVKPRLKKRLMDEWEYIGELNKMHCFRRPRQVACFLKWDDAYHLYGGSPTPEETAQIAADLGIEWEPWS